MTHVLAISIGPVAHFIAAGRRSRDLWYGSTWLSETTRRVAVFLNGQLHRDALLLPSAKRLDEIAENDEFGKHGGRISNKILAVVTPPASDDPHTFLRRLAKECRRQARQVLVNELERVRDRPLDGILDADGLRRQLKAIAEGDFLEFAAAWAPIPKGTDPFGGAVARACALRDGTPKLFVHPSFSHMGIARSDLDEGRDSVLLPENRQDSADIRQRRAQCGLIESEELDALGLLRRVSPYLRRQSVDMKHGELPFPPVTRIAVDAWLEGCSQSPKAKEALAKLCKVIEYARESQRENFFIWCTPSAEPRAECFPYEASVLLDGGVEALRKSTHKMLNGQGPWMDIDRALHEVQTHVHTLHRIAGRPIPYYAFIEMDGDGIGKLLETRETQESYQACIRNLDAFADSASKIVEKHGTAFYVAGDELAAYVPLDKALDVVHEVASDFTGKVKGQTMSAGIVFAHARDDLRGVREAARAALSDAKKARKMAESPTDGYVCLREMPRAGSDRQTVLPLSQVHADLNALVKAILDGRISLRTEQHLRDHVERFKGVTGPAETPPGILLAQDAVRRQFQRSGDRQKEDPLTERVDRLHSWDDVEQLANELRMASRIADVRAQRGNRHE